MQSVSDRAGADKATPTRGELVDLLNREIDEELQEHTSPGWTPVALLGGAGSIAWLALTEYESSKTPFMAIALVAIAIRLVADGWSGLSAIEDAFHPSRRKSPQFVPSKRLLSLSKPQMHIQFADLVVHAWCAGTLRQLAGVWSYLAMAHYALCALAIVTAVLISRVDVHIPTGPPRTKLVGWSTVLSQCLPFASAFGMITAIGLLPRDQLSDALKIGALLFTSLALVRQFASRPSVPPLMHELSQLRRSIVLDGRSPVEGAREMQVLMYGLELGRVLQVELQPAIREVRTHSDQLATLATRTAELRERLGADGDVTAEVDGRELREHVVSAARLARDGAHKAAKAVNYAIARAQLLSFIGGGNAETLRDAAAELTQSLAAVKTERAKLLEGLRSIRAELKRRSSVPADGAPIVARE